MDAGYLYAAGAIALTGSAQNREKMNLRQNEAIAKLANTATGVAKGASLLRIYWYDGLLGGRPSPEQEALANSDNVKVKLGAVVAGRQKGVDSLIVTDLIELARNHALSDAVLLSGDEDLRVGVQMAQGFGVRIHLIGIVPSRGNQSHLLMQEADTTIEWSRADIEEIMPLRPAEEAELETSAAQKGSGSGGDVEFDLLRKLASQVVESIAQSELGTVANAIHMNRDLVPSDYDKILLLKGAALLGRNLTQAEKHRVRDNFKEVVKARLEEIE